MTAVYSWEDFYFLFVLGNIPFLSWLFLCATCYFDLTDMSTGIQIIYIYLFIYFQAGVLFVHDFLHWIVLHIDHSRFDGYAYFNMSNVRFL